MQWRLQAMNWNIDMKQWLAIVPGCSKANVWKNSNRDPESSLLGKVDVLFQLVKRDCCATLLLFKFHTDRKECCTTFLILIFHILYYTSSSHIPQSKTQHHTFAPYILFRIQRIWYHTVKIELCTRLLLHTFHFREKIAPHSCLFHSTQPKGYIVPPSGFSHSTQVKRNIVPHSCFSHEKGTVHHAPVSQIPRSNTEHYTTFLLLRFHLGYREYGITQEKHNIVPDSCWSYSTRKTENIGPYSCLSHSTQQIGNFVSHSYFTSVTENIAPQSCLSHSTQQKGNIVSHSHFLHYR